MPTRFSLDLMHNKRGSVMILAAFSIIILVALMMGVLTISQVSLAKRQLQSACDASVLATRKAFSQPGEFHQATLEGQKYFAISFPHGAYANQSAQITLTLVDAYEVKGEARATLENLAGFAGGAATRDITASCAARMDLPNLDVMFAFDTTLSMINTDPGESLSRIDGARAAVMDFYDKAMQFKSPDVRVRIGFVPFSENVNVGRLLRKEWMVDQWTYQSRQYVSTVMAADGTPRYLFRYAPITYDVSALKGDSSSPYMNGTSIVAPNMGLVNDTIYDPVVTWSGCIEERNTYNYTWDMNWLMTAPDMNIDLIPGNDGTRWRPHLPGLTYWRKDPSQSWIDADGFVKEEVITYKNMRRVPPGASVCPAPAKKLSVVSRQDLQDYMATLEPDGATYLDIPMIWAARLLSPTGIFADENQTAPNNGPISRHIILLTDGQIAAAHHHYTAYGTAAMEWRNIKEYWINARSFNPADLNTVIAFRMKTACEAARRKGITVWAIAFATNMNRSLIDCAGQEHAVAAANAQQLDNALLDILSKIARLRLVQ
jgi:Putative Flp pilus-assembly TadE/G-like